MAKWFRDLKWLDRTEWGLVGFFLAIAAVMIGLLVFVLTSSERPWLAVAPVLALVANGYILKTNIDICVRQHKRQHAMEISMAEYLKEMNEGDK